MPTLPQKEKKPVPIDSGLRTNDLGVLFKKRVLPGGVITEKTEKTFITLLVYLII